MILWHVTGSESKLAVPTSLRRKVERGVAVADLNVGACTCTQEHLDDALVATRGGDAKRRHRMAALRNRR